MEVSWAALTIDFDNNLYKSDDITGVFAGLPILKYYKGKFCCWHFKKNREKNKVS